VRNQNNTSLLIRALEFAARKHRMHRRKDEDASPYINHPIALMSVLCIEAQRVRVLHLGYLGEFGPHARDIGVQLCRPLGQGLVGEHGSETIPVDSRIKTAVSSHPSRVGSQHVSAPIGGDPRPDEASPWPTTKYDYLDFWYVF
jgi:hypothetical protein